MCCVHNIILGKLWIEQYGTVEIFNHRYNEESSVDGFKLLLSHVDISYLPQHGGEVCVKLQTLWDVWERAAQGRRSHPRQEVSV